MSNRYVSILFILASVILIVVGGGIYFSYRTETLMMFRCTDSLHLNGFVEKLRQSMSIYTPSDFVKYNLPDGLWSISYFLIILSIWGNIGRENVVWFCLMPIIALISEFMQLTSIMPGQFDWWDVMCYSFPLIILITIKTVKICTKRKSYQELQ